MHKMVINLTFSAEKWYTGYSGHLPTERFTPILFFLRLFVFALVTSTRQMEDREKDMQNKITPSSCQRNRSLDTAYQLDCVHATTITTTTTTAPGREL